MRSYLDHPCFNEFFKDKSSEKRESILDSREVRYEYSKDINALRLYDYQSNTYNIRHGERKTCYKSHGVKKVFFFGGSTIEGLGVSDCETIPSFFQKINPKFDVYNLGVRGSYSDFELNAFIQNDIPTGSVAIFFDGLNENFHDQWVPNIKKSTFGKWLLGSDFITGSLLLKGGLNLDYESSKKCVPRPSHAIVVTKKMKLNSTEIANRYLKNVEKISKLCLKREIKCFFFLQPAPSFQYRHNLFFYDGDGAFSDAQYSYGTFVKNVRIANSVAIDLSGALLSVPNAYVDKVHYSPEANLHLANQISKRVLWQR